MQAEHGKEQRIQTESLLRYEFSKQLRQTDELVEEQAEQ